MDLTTFINDRVSIVVYSRSVVITVTKRDVILVMVRKTF